MKNLILITGLITVFFVSIARCETLIMPQELVEFARKNGCDQVVNFYERPAMINPPYAYGYMHDKDEEDSAVFWCEKKINNESIYYLLTMIKGDDKNELSKCTSKIEWKNFPAGLSIYKSQKETLEQFVYIDEPEKKAPKDVSLQHNGILNEYDGVSEIFYCYQGKWLILMRD